jgi:uncharacterized protein with von Willebrand factor type A (vWA) domain
MLRVVDELLWSLRRSGFRIATSQAIDAARAVAEVGLEDRNAVKEALACVVVDRSRERARFDAVFDAFFSSEPRRTLWERLLASGFTETEIGALRELLESARAGADAGLAPLLHRGAELDRLFYLAGVTRALDSMQSTLQAGFFVHKVLAELGLPRAHDALAHLRSLLRDALGPRGDVLADALARELERAAEEVRDHVGRSFEGREREIEEARRGRTIETTEFTSLAEREIDEVRRAVRAFATRLSGGERVRRRRAERGRIDPHKTLRRALRTGGVPFSPARTKRRRDKPRLLLLCDISDSVRTVARFLLELCYAAQELFERTRSFVFVSELGETTELFAREPIAVALGHAYGGGVVSVASNSNYGRVLSAFEERHMRDLDRRTTVVVLGDGRTNYQGDGAEVLGRIRERARALVWLCPESRAGWSLGDSAMARYAPKCTRVLEVRTARELEEATRAVLAFR